MGGTLRDKLKTGESKKHESFVRQPRIPNPKIISGTGINIQTWHMVECNEVCELLNENIYYDDEELATTEEQNDEDILPEREEVIEEMIEEEQHDHAPVIVEGEPEGYSEPEGCEENTNELDEEAINVFILQLFQLKKQNLLKKKESKLIPSVNKFLKLDFEQKGEQITPTVTKNLLHICELILTNKIDVTVSPGDQEVLEYIVDKDTLVKDIKFTFVEDFRIQGYIRKAKNLIHSWTFLQTNTARQKIFDDATRTPEAAGLIESHATAVNSVKSKSTLAGRDIINYLRKKDNYQKSLATPTDDDAVDPPPAQPQATPKVGTIASAEKLINAHFKAKGIIPSEDGIKIGDATLGISYNDVVMDLTHNFTRTQPSLTIADRKRVLLLLKKSKMPVSYVRNRKLKEEYKVLLGGEQTKSMIPVPKRVRGATLPTLHHCCYNSRRGLNQNTDVHKVT
ncbi:Hypothetical predicted protein [Paramuricea clavata]|uniref:Uncharacterized protein n=1 Tax=Paramuricea clavata TaxID=317549 RepID=A0A6S7HMN9_PARCT|nr:Hypothetical predicted protein [Paramuricea clavata]